MKRTSNMKSLDISELDYKTMMIIGAFHACAAMALLSGMARAGDEQCSYKITSPSYEDTFHNVWESYISVNGKEYKASDYRDANIGTGIFVLLINPDDQIGDGDSFNTHEKEEESWRFNGFIEGALPGTVILLATADEYTKSLTNDAKILLHKMGGPNRYEYRSSLALVTVKTSYDSYSPHSQVYNLRGEGPSVLDYSGACRSAEQEQKQRAPLEDSCTVNITSPSYSDSFGNVWESYITVNGVQHKASDYRTANIGTGIFVLLLGSGGEIQGAGSFNTHAAQEESWNFSGFVSGAQPGSVVVLATADEFTKELSTDAKQVLTDMGAPSELETRSSLALIAVKNGNQTFTHVDSVYRKAGMGPSVLDYAGPCSGQPGVENKKKTKPPTTTTTTSTTTTESPMTKAKECDCKDLSNQLDEIRTRLAALERQNRNIKEEFLRIVNFK